MTCSTRWIVVLLAPWLLVACNDDGGTEPESTSTMDPATTSTTDPGATSVTDPGATSVVDTEDTTVTDTADTTDTVDTTDPTIPTCGCTEQETLEPVPEACADLEVPPAEILQLAGWMAEPSTIMATSKAPYYCTPPDPDAWNVECPCSGILDLLRLEFGSSSFELGETTVSLIAADALCGDVCQTTQTNPLPDIPVQIIAVSDTCIIAEALRLGSGVRFYVDRQACGA